MTDPRRKPLNRRRFLGGAAAALAAPAIVPASALGRDGRPAPSERVTVGLVGCGSRGTGAILPGFQNVPAAQMLATCDVSRGNALAAAQRAGVDERSVYSDYREILERDDIDAVAIATPDHWHALIAVDAARAGKDVYCEKPLSNTISEGRAIAEAVRRYGVIFQHGTQLKSMSGTRRACELVRNGYIGALHTITIGSPPGQATGWPAIEAPPADFDYDMWLGPAPEAPYSRTRVTQPGWYFISDYSKAGWVAGYAVHDLDIAQWGMGLEHSGPISVEGEGVFPEDGLFDTVLTFRLEFKYANGVKLVLTDTGQNRHGVRFEGDDGWVFTRGGVEASPERLMRQSIAANDVHLYKSDDHGQNFIDCVRTRRRTITPAEIAQRSTTPCLIGGIALKLRRPLRWDPETEHFIDDPQANRLLSYAMRPPWALRV